MTSLITGGGSGIGRAIALRLAQRGDEIIILDFNSKAGGETAALIEEAGGKARSIQCDVGDTASVQAAFEQIETLNVLVTSAGIAHVGNVENTTPDDLDRLYRINVK